MTWKSHKAIAACGALALKMPVVGVIVITISSILPDVLEFSTGLKHRGILHWWGIPVGGLLGAYFLKQVNPLVAQTVSYISIGWLLHILCDMLTVMGVPLWPNSKGYVALRLFRVGSPGEYFFVLVICALLLYPYVSRFYNPHAIGEWLFGKKAVIRGGRRGGW